MKQYVNRNQADKLKAIEYNQPSVMYYKVSSSDGITADVESEIDDRLYKSSLEINHNKYKNYLSAPDVDEVVNWFRDVHNLNICIYPRFPLTWQIRIHQLVSEKRTDIDINSNERSKVLSYAIDQVIEIVENK